jgi:hypothetical protein
MIVQIDLDNHDDRFYVDFVNEQLDIAARQDRSDPDYEPIWPDETGDIPVSISELSFPV